MTIVERLRNGGQTDLADIAELMLEALEVVAMAPEARDIRVLDRQDMRLVSRAIKKATGSNWRQERIANLTSPFEGSAGTQ